MRQTFAILILVLLVAACGGNACSSSPTSRGSGGASASSSTTAASTGGTGGTGGSGGASGTARVTVRVTDQNQQPIAGTPIVVNDAAGAVFAVVVSGTDGQVQAAVPNGGSVSAYSSVGLLFHGVSVFAPPNGSTVGIVLEQAAPASPTPPALTVYQDQVSQIPPTTSDLVFYSCAPSYDETLGTPVPSSLVYATSNSACPEDSTASFLTIAIDTLGTPLAWAAAFDQPTAPGGQVNLAQVLDQRAFDTLTASIVGIASGAAQTDIELQPAASAMGPLAYALLQVATVATGSPSSYSAQFWTPTGLFTSYTVTEQVVFEMGSAESHIGRQRSYAHLPVNTTFAADSMALLSVAPLDLTDPVHPRVTWQAGDGARGDYGEVVLRWTSGTATTLYAALFPSDPATSFRLPDMPPELSSYAPSATSTFSSVLVDDIDEETATDYAHSSIFQAQPVVDGLGLVFSGGSNATVVQ